MSTTAITLPMQAEKPAQQPFYSYRSVQQCLSQGISFLTDHFLRFLWVSCPVAAPLALLLALLVFHACYLRYYVGDQADIVLMAIVSLLILCCASAYIGFIHRLIVRHKEGLSFDRLPFRKAYDRLFWRLSLYALVVNLFTLLLAAVCTGFGWAVDHWVVGGRPPFFHWAWGSLIALLLILVLCPVNQCWAACALSGKSLWGALLSGYRLGWQRWAKVFSLSLLTSIIVCVVSLLLLSPAVVVALTQMSATQSQLAGDVVTLPAGFAVTTFLILFVSMVICSLLNWVQLVPQAYLYASLQTQAASEESR